MQDCILDEGNGRARLMKIEEGRQELTIARPNEDYFFGYRVRNYALQIGSEMGMYLIASEEPLEEDKAADLIAQLKPNPISIQPN